MSKMKIGTKISVGFAIVIVLTVIMGASSYVSLKDIIEGTQSQLDVITPAQTMSIDLNVHAQKTTIGFLRYMAYENPDYFKEVASEIALSEEAARKLVKLVGDYPELTENIKAYPPQALDALVR